MADITLLVNKLEIYRERIEYQKYAMSLKDENSWRLSEALEDVTSIHFSITYSLVSVRYVGQSSCLAS